ncbi:glycosyl transferase family 1 [Aphanothece hegewaldii CCALA 016]|uniref:Glycosyl transferase family 1 n=1 Tax=Aphanothece hegewaldii CCALA 016 TaxID=2107694 RepID=A0A2T1M2A1_9CHRO|nr:glycosyltransferase [Aphanothece hegewaldii]PSF38886.1 glycosyl transferase family 1 [Aphanothece hegewaldii CCALA 016]
MKYALVHEWLTPKATGGSELVVKDILGHINADLYALIDFESTNPQSYLYGRQIGTTFLQNFPKARNGVQKYLPLLPLAIEQLDLRDYDIILSSSHAVAKGVITRPHQLHICYCHTPMRYAWDLTFDYLQDSRAGQGVLGILTRYLLHRLRQWDVISSNQVDYFIANSQHTARRIWRCYRRSSKVIYPPVDIDRFSFQTQKEDFYLTVSRLVSYKKIPLIVEAFNQLGLPLVLIGDGPQLELVRQMAKSNITILGGQPNSVVEQYMSRSKAFVYAACEDFGIAPVEAQACGTPVIALGTGGALETVKDIRKFTKNGTGILFEQQTVESLVKAVETFCEIGHQIKPDNCRLQATRFTPKIFISSYLAFLDDCRLSSVGKSSPNKISFL